jgi:hypothetical protein
VLLLTGMHGRPFGLEQIVPALGHVTATDGARRSLHKMSRRVAALPARTRFLRFGPCEAVHRLPGRSVRLPPDLGASPPNPGGGAGSGESAVVTAVRGVRRRACPREHLWELPDGLSRPVPHNGKYPKVPSAPRG